MFDATLNKSMRTHINLEPVGDDNRWRIDDDRLIEHGEFSPEACAALLNEVMTLAELAEGLNISYNSLAKAAREGRIQARQSGATWLSTIAAVKQAIKAGTIRPREK